MKKGSLSLLLGIALIFVLEGCSNLFGKKSAQTQINDGQLRGANLQSTYKPTRPFGMVYVPSGTFHMGPSDEDVNYAYSARNRQVSINGFWMDATEITNNEYRQFVNWVRDSVVARKMGYVKSGADGNEYVDWKKMQSMKWSDPKIGRAHV